MCANIHASIFFQPWKFWYDDGKESFLLTRTNVETPLLIKNDSE